MTYQFRSETFVPGTVDEVFAFFSNAANLGKITPPMLHFRIQSQQPIVMRPGAEIDYTIQIHSVPVRWRTIIEKWEPPYEFHDVQARGPYNLWHHTHRFRAVDGGVVMEDIVNYALPFGPLGSLVHWLFVKHDIEGIFEYRAQRIKELMGGRVSAT
jgi:ligand-binding SRPBCC domain-containing protein